MFAPVQAARPVIRDLPDSRFAFQGACVFGPPQVLALLLKFPFSQPGNRREGLREGPAHRPVLTGPMRQTRSHVPFVNSS